MYSKSAQPGDELKLWQETEACDLGVRANWSMVLLQDQDIQCKLSERISDHILYFGIYILPSENLMPNLPMINNGLILAL